MAKQLIVLEHTGQGQFRVAYWVTPPVARQPFYASATATSAWSGASAPEITAIQSGSVVERVEAYSVEGTPTLAAVQAGLLARWAALNTEIQTANPWDRYGTYYDGTWHAAGVA